MDFKKIYKRGLGFLFLLLIFIIGVLFIPNLNKKQEFDGNSIFTSAPEDNYEPNNNPTFAYDITSNEGNWLSSHNGTGTQWDDDWYMININPGKEQLSIMLTFNHSEGDIDIELYDNSIVLITGSYGVMDNEYIDVIVPSSGIYFVKVYLDNMGNLYDLWWNTTLSTDDAYEENDFDWEAYDLSPWSASWLPFGLGVQSDDDWFTVYLDPGEERIYAELSFSHAAGNIDMEIWYWDGIFTHLTGSYSFDDNEYIDTIVPWSGTYYIIVFGDNTGNLYDLWWEDLMVTGGDDYMEENDDYWSAKLVGLNYYSDLKIVYGDEDWFHTYLNPGDIIDVSIYFDHMEGDLQLEFYDPSYIHRVGSYSGNNDEFISFTADISGDWRIRVYHAFGDSEVWYDLNIWLYAGSPGVEDAYEENDFYGQAYDLSYYEGRWLSGISGFGSQFDEDWYKINVEPSFEHLIVNFNQFDGDIQLEVYDTSINIIGGSYHREYNEPIMITLPSSGTYYFKVSGSNKGTNYDLQYIAFCLLEEQTWLSDVYGMGIQGDLDFYLIDVSPGFLQLEINLSFIHSSGDINMALYNEMGSDIIKAESLDDNEYINDNLTYPGMHFLLIYGDNMGNEYNLWWDDHKTDLRSDDNYEINNDPSSAYDISFAQNKSLWEMNGLALQFDEDWYEIYVDGSNLELIVWLPYDSAEGLMGFEVYDEDLNKITGNFTLTDNDYIVHDVSNGTHYIRVFGDNSGNVYNLWWATQESEEIGMIPGYDLLILIASIIGISTVGIKIKRSKLKHK